MRLTTLVASLAVAGAVVSAGQQNPYLGKWNISGTGQDAANVYWLEVKQEGERLTGMFLNRVGNPNPLGLVKVENGELVFQEGRPDRLTGPEYRARLEDGKLVGRHSVSVGGRGRRGGAAVNPNAPPPPPPPPPRVVEWIGVRPPAWPAANANGRHTYGPPVVLFDGTSLDAWGVQTPSRPMGWSIVEGLMTNGGTGGAPARANNLVSKATFSDFKIEAEYKLADHSNSGIYLRGRYELQLLDDFADTTTRADLSHMAIYGRTPPSVKASKPMGEWQTMEAIVVANRVTVTLNGQRVHDNAVIEGVTGGTLDNNEAAPGPILVQGDHSQVWVRKLVVTPITKAGTGQ